MVDIDACHLLLRRLWQFDQHSLHDEYTNTYSFLFGKKKIVLLLDKSLAKIVGNSTNLLTRVKFETKMAESGVTYVLVCKSVDIEQEVLTEFDRCWKNFKRFFQKSF